MAHGIGAMHSYGLYGKLDASERDERITEKSERKKFGRDRLKMDDAVSLKVRLCAGVTCPVGATGCDGRATRVRGEGTATGPDTGPVYGMDENRIPRSN